MRGDWGIDNVSLTSDGYCACFAHCALDRRTVAEIQGRIVGKRERGLLSRLAHAKNDKETIAAWRSDLIRILQVFNVRSAGSVRSPLITSSQTELTLSAHIMVSDMHQNMLKGCEDTSGKGQAVSDISTPPSSNR